MDNETLTKAINLKYLQEKTEKSIENLDYYLNRDFEEKNRGCRIEINDCFMGVIFDKEIYFKILNFISFEQRESLKKIQSQIENL